MTFDVFGRGRLLAGAAMVVAASCGGDGSTGPAASPVGEYRLQSRDGVAVPVVISTGDSLLSATLSVRADSTFVSIPTYRTGGGTPWTRTIAGRWTGTPTALRYLDGGGMEIATGTYTRARITFVQGSTYEFVAR